jgi:hypothetical protein
MADRSLSKRIVAPILIHFSTKYQWKVPGGLAVAPGAEMEYDKARNDGRRPHGYK